MLEPIRENKPLLTYIVYYATPPTYNALKEYQCLNVHYIKWKWE